MESLYQPRTSVAKDNGAQQNTPVEKSFKGWHSHQYSWLERRNGAATGFSKRNINPCNPSCNIKIAIEQVFILHKYHPDTEVQMIFKQFPSLPSRDEM